MYPRSDTDYVPQGERQSLVYSLGSKTVFTSQLVFTFLLTSIQSPQERPWSVNDNVVTGRVNWAWRKRCFVKQGCCYSLICQRDYEAYYYCDDYLYVLMHSLQQVRRVGHQFCLVYFKSYEIKLHALTWVILCLTQTTKHSRKHFFSQLHENEATRSHEQ